MFYYIWWEFFKGSFVKIFAEKVARENSVQIHPNFPAKSLIHEKFSLTPFLLIQLLKL